MGKHPMRIAKLAFAGSVAALVMASPVLAKHSEAQKGVDDAKSASSSCHAYQQAADGSWTQLPCQDAGGQTQPKPIAKSGEEEPR
jgi:hypothetical protein